MHQRPAFGALLVRSDTATVANRAPVPATTRRRALAHPPDRWDAPGPQGPLPWRPGRRLAYGLRRFLFPRAISVSSASSFGSQNPRKRPSHASTARNGSTSTE
jgi:hypothetical protein